MSKPCVIISGNLSDGFKAAGPFTSFDEAAAAEENERDNTWIMTLNKPINKRQDCLFQFAKMIILLNDNGLIKDYDKITKLMRIDDSLFGELLIQASNIYKGRNK